MQPEMEREVSLTWKGRSSKRTGRGRRRAGAFAALAIAFAVARAPDVAHAQAADVLPAQASPAGPVRELTLDQALVLAKRGNKNLVVERARLAQAHTNIEQAWSALFPVVTAQGKYTRNYKNATLNFGALLMGLGCHDHRGVDGWLRRHASSSRISSTPTSAPSCRSSRRPPTRRSTR